MQVAEIDSLIGAPAFWQERRSVESLTADCTRANHRVEELEAEHNNLAQDAAAARESASGVWQPALFCTA